VYNGRESAHESERVRGATEGEGEARCEGGRGHSRSKGSGASFAVIRREVPRSFEVTEDEMPEFESGNVKVRRRV